MEFATGALGTLLPKLGKLLLDEYNLQKGLKKGIKDLRDELLVIQAALVRVSDVPLDQLHPLVKIWANDVRELSFAIEDSLDSFMVRVEGLEPTKPHTFFGFIKKACKKVTKLKIRREIANDIKDVKIQVKEVKERYDRYKDVIGNTNARTEVDPRLLAMYSKVSDLVGIEKSMDELTERLLSEGDNPSGEKLKVVSVVGFGGLGKTTLAKAVYEKLKKNFDCGVFVPVGQSPDTKKVLRDILLELDRELYKASATMDERQLINELQAFLVGKRYFFVMDDIWDIRTWEMIKCAFMDSHPESRLIITTRIVDVATKAGGIYNMEPLSNENSEILFYTRTCGGEGLTSSNQHVKVTNKILKKCGGVPLAIITIASLLVGKPSEDWSQVYDAIGFGHEDSEVVQNTRKILSFSYYDLPSHLKTCLLYLSMFPEDSFIEKNLLIWRWVSEGFVPDRSFQLGESYFSKLVNRSMIRWIDRDDDFDGQSGCRVHDMVLDLIRTISNEINFVTVHDTEHHGTCSGGKSTNKVRRLAVHGKSGERNCSIAMEHVRSFNVVANSMPLLSSFKVLRVLVIEDCDFSEGSSLEHLGKLAQLRYLGLVKTAVKIPEGIGHDLKLLEILDVRGGLISELPPSVGELMNLRCLWADEGTVMKGEIGKLTCLEELQLYSVEKCPNFFTEVGKLTKLRVLKIFLGEIEESAGKALIESLFNLHKIHTLWVLDDGHEGKYSVVLNHSLEDLAPCTKLYELFLPGIVIPRVPSWINHLSAPLLSYLWLHVEAVEVRDVQTIGRLPSLLVLGLWSKDEESISYTFGSNEFHKLTVLYTKKIEIAVGEGALPMLEFLAYSASAERKDAASLVPWRSNGCPLLKKVVCLLDCTNSSYREVKEAKQALKQASRTRPNLDLNIEKQNYDKEAGKFTDNLEWILRGLDRPEDVGRPAAHQEERMRRMIRSLERRLRDAGEPRVGRYGQQEIRGLVTKFKSWLHDHAGTDQDEAGKNDATDQDDEDDEDYYYGDDDVTDQAEMYRTIKSTDKPMTSPGQNEGFDNGSAGEISDESLPEALNTHRGTDQNGTSANSHSSSSYNGGLWSNSSRLEHHRPITKPQTAPPERRLSNLEPSKGIDMELSPVSASLGAMGSLPWKLNELLATKHRALQGILMDEIHQLTADLCILYNFMLNLSDVLQDPPMAARYWMKDVRELSYDMDDFADQFVHAHGSAKIPRANHRKNKTISRVKIVRLSKRSKWQPGITNKVSEFRTRAQEAIRRYRRYKFDGCAFNPGCSHIGRGRPTILPHPDDLVGIEGPSNELERWLIDGEEQLKVVSIVGVAGVGKTTLALRLWGKLRGQFECGAFVRIAQKPDMRGILRNILLQVRPNQPPSHGEMRHLINDLREYLQDKRYFVIIDDLWVTSVWDVVSRAFPKSGFSRVITTAEIMEVALACCGFCPEHIYKMESLNDNDSEKLLLQRIRVSGNQSPLQFDDAIPQIIRSCGGFPLAIIIVARILASQPEKLEHWGRAQNSFDSIFGSNPTKEGFMGQILDICFNSLPPYLKTCLLYLSTYAEGYLFLKDDLVKQWVAECFICANEGEDMEEVAGSYFDELVSMGLIQVMDIYCDYELLSYSVHQLVLDLITYKSIEENFITVVDYSQTRTSLPDKVRRLALHFGSAAYASTPESTGLSQVRSLFFSGLFNCIPSFMVFKLLRVLILHFWDDTGTKTLNLTVICELLWLRYLQVTCNAIVKLPDKIETMKHLETLEINARVLDVPPDIVRLSSLLHLCLRGSNLPNGIRCIRSLRTLMYFDLGSSCEDNLCGLGELTNLRDLHLTYSSSPSSEHLKRNLIALASSLGKLCNLKSLTLDAGIAGTAGTVVLSDGSSGIRAPIFLEKLKLLPPIFIFSRLPKWIGQLRKICIMKAAVRELPLSDIAILAGLPSLTVLSLSVQMAPEGRIVFNNRAFPVLKYFKFRCGVLCMSFMAGAMPNLHRLKLGFNAHIGEKYDNMIAGIEHLLYLQNITGQIGATSVSEWRAAESAINDAINKHPRFPRRNLQWVDPVEEECNPSVKHHWSQGKSSLGEKHGVLDKANDMNEHVDMGLSQLPNLPSTVASGRLKSGIVEALEESNQSPDPSFPSSLR